MNETFHDSRNVLSQDSSINPALDLIHENYAISVYPLFELSFANDNKEDFLQQYSAGAQLNLNSNKVNFGFTYLYANREYMSYRSDLINSRGVVPSIGLKSGINTISSHYFDGYLSYQPNKIFDFEVGYGRKFIGSGHRSLLLSDHSAPYPYLKIQTKFWKLKYTNLFSSQLNSFGVTSNSDWYQQKFTASHFLELELFNKLSIGLFETVVWQADEGTYYRGLDVNYLNPVIFYRPVEFSVGSSDNVLIGSNIKYEFLPKYVFYFQAILDEFLLSEMRADFSQWLNEDEDIQSGWWGNKYGLQLGLMADDAFGIEGLFLRTEYNLVRPFTYAHSSPTQAYTHHSLPLAHQLGANFEEAIVQMRYQMDRWTFKAQYNQSRWGRSPVGTNYGEETEYSNLTRIKEYENTIGQGITTFTYYVETSVSRKMSFLWGADLSLGYVWRQAEAQDQIDMNNMVFLSLRTNIFRQHFDF